MDIGEMNSSSPGQRIILGDNAHASTPIVHQGKIVDTVPNESLTIEFTRPQKARRAPGVCFMLLLGAFCVG